MGTLRRSRLVTRADFLISKLFRVWELGNFLSTFKISVEVNWLYHLSLTRTDHPGLPGWPVWGGPVVYQLPCTDVRKGGEGIYFQLCGVRGESFPAIHSSVVEWNFIC